MVVSHCSLVLPIQPGISPGLLCFFAIEPRLKPTFTNFTQHTEQTIHFIHGVVVHEADTQEAARLFHVEALGEVESVVVSVPGEEAAVAEFGGEGERRVSLILIYGAHRGWGSARRSRTGR